MRRVKYLNNRDLLAQIHKSKGTYSSFVDSDDHAYDVIVPTLEKINIRSIALAKKNKAKKKKTCVVKKKGSTREEGERAKASCCRSKRKKTKKTQCQSGEQSFEEQIGGMAL